MDRPSFSYRARRIAATTLRSLAGAALCVAAVACDTGDGKTLRPPTSPTTVPITTPATTLVAVEPDLDATLPGDAQQFTLVAPWNDGTPIDRRYTCDAEDVSPPLSWFGAPADAVEMAIVVTDESITNGPAFVHWVIAGIDPSEISLVEGSVPVGAVQALNFFGEIGWNGPCPPPGDSPHEYIFRIYALNQQVELADGTPAVDMIDVVESVAIASTDVVGTYGR